MFQVSGVGGQRLETVGSN